MGLFRKKTVTKTYDKKNKKPVIKASICNGEQVAGFKDIHTGKIEEVMLIKNQADLDAFKKMYGIDVTLGTWRHFPLLDTSLSDTEASLLSFVLSS